MKPTRIYFRTAGLAVALAASTPPPLLACAACFGQSDSPLAQGMNWGIFTLLGVVVTVLAGVAGFFVFLMRKAAAAAATGTDGGNDISAEVQV